MVASKVRLLIITLLFAIPSFTIPPAFAATEHDLASWIGLLFQGTFNEKVGYYVEIQDRLNQNLASGNRSIIRPALRYFFSPHLSLWVGYGWMPAFSPFRNENRVWQQLLYEENFGPIQIVGRLRIDERWIGSSENVAYRARLMLRSLQRVDEGRKLFLCEWVEYLQHLNTVSTLTTAGMDQSRVFLGVNYKVTPEIAIEPGYLNLFVNGSSGNSVMNHIFALYGIFNL